MAIFLLCLWFFLLGAALGSFYNVVIDRLPEGRDVVRLRSSCSACKTQLGAADMIPVFSFLFLRGRCRYCGTRLSPWYFISELTVGVLFVTAFLKYAGDADAVWLIGALYLWSLLFITGVMDAKTGMIMDLFPLLIGVGGLVFGLLSHRSLWQILLGAATGAALYGAVYLIARMVLGREGLGLGDVFLMAGIGFWFSWGQMIIIAFLTAYVSLIFIAVKAIREKKLGLRSELPLGPSICIAAWIMSLFGTEIVHGLRLLLRL